jgi:hypothetical protein
MQRQVVYDSHRMISSVADSDPLVRGTDPDPDPLVRGTDPDPSIMKQK